MTAGCFPVSFWCLSYAIQLLQLICARTATSRPSDFLCPSIIGLGPAFPDARFFLPEDVHQGAVIEFGEDQRPYLARIKPLLQGTPQRRVHTGEQTRCAVERVGEAAAAGGSKPSLGQKTGASFAEEVIDARTLTARAIGRSVSTKSNSCTASSPRKSSTARCPRGR